jgi:hypothetical protein
VFDVKTLFIALAAVIITVAVFVQERRIFDREASLRSAFWRAYDRLKKGRRPLWKPEEEAELAVDLAWVRKEIRISKREGFAPLHY